MRFIAKRTTDHLARHFERNYSVKRILGVAIQVFVIWAILMLLYFVGLEFLLIF